MRRAEFFKQPPSSIEDRVNGTIAFPIWPQSMFLARMAGVQPQQVCRIILEIPDTANERIHEDFADAASKLPVGLARRWVEKEIKWLKGQQYFHWQLPEKLGGLIPRLAGKSDTTDLAIELARELLRVMPAGKGDGKRKTSLFDEPRARFLSYYYERIIENDIPALFRARPEAVVRLFCELLSEAIGFSTSENDATVRDDGSYIWHQGIEHGGKRHDDDVRGLLVTAVRDMAQALAKSNPASVPSLVLQLESYRWPLFRRLTLHILRLYPTNVEEMITDRLTDKENFESRCLWHEYFLLLKERFHNLPESAQATILSWIEFGPDFSNVRSDAIRSEEERQSYKQAWQLRHLIPIKEDLPPTWKEYYQRLLVQHPEPEHPEYMYWIGEVRWGLSSPKKAEELKTLGVSELVTFLRTWEPAQSQFDSTPEGLGEELKKLVKSDPEHFITELEQFKGLDPTYIRAIISGFHERTKQRAPVAYEPILDMGQWVVAQPNEIPGRRIHSIDQDPDWAWTKLEITRFLEAGLEQGESEIPFEFRTKVWSIIDVLCQDPDPTAENEKKHYESNMDPSTLSLNTVRGQAMHSVIKYALWVRRHLTTELQGEEKPSFDQMPEVRLVLDDHVEPTRDPSEAIRSVYGQWLPTLAFLDQAWVQQSRERIFPRETALAHLRRSAWDSFIMFSSPSWALFDLLREEYQYAVSQIGAPRLMGGHLGDPNIHLVDHLMFLYWTGKITLEGDEMLAQFFKHASPELRGRAINFVGLSLYHTKDPVPADIIGRLKHLFESRLGQAKVSGSIQPFERELASFGWWFASGKFEVQWSLPRLEDVLELNGSVESEHLVVEQLAAAATELPEVAVECFEKIIESDKHGWRIPAWRESTRSVLSVALRGRNDRARRTARRLVNKLTARGYLEYRDLLGE